MTLSVGLLPVRERRLLERSARIVGVLDQAFNPHVLRGLEQVWSLPTGSVVKRRGRIRIVTKESKADVLAWSIGQKIRVARERRNWTQEDLANQTGIARANIARLEIGRHAPRIETLRRVARVLDLDPGKFLRMPKYRATAEDSDWLENGMDEWAKSLDRDDSRP